MRILDFTIQTLLLLAVVMFLPFGKEGVILIALVQLAMGLWQLISAIVTTSKMNHGDSIRTTMIRVYWFLVVFYFAGLGLMCYLDNDFLATAWFFSAWLIAIYYYVITIRNTFMKQRISFMDIGN